jgi:hypothetical protein
LGLMLLEGQLGAHWSFGWGEDWLVLRSGRRSKEVEWAVGLEVGQLSKQLILRGSSWTKKRKQAAMDARAYRRACAGFAAACSTYALAIPPIDSPLSMLTCTLRS